MKYKLLLLAAACINCSHAHALTRAEVAENLSKVFDKIAQGTVSKNEVKKALDDARQYPDISISSYLKKAGITQEDLKMSLREEPRRDEDEERRRREREETERREREQAQQREAERQRREREEAERREREQAQQREAERQRREREEAQQREEQRRQEEERKKREEEREKIRKQEEERKKREAEEARKREEERKKAEEERKRKEEEEREKPGVAGLTAALRDLKKGNSVTLAELIDANEGSVENLKAIKKAIESAGLVNDAEPLYSGLSNWLKEKEGSKI
jgi:hypothetical protein